MTRYGKNDRDQPDAKKQNRGGIFEKQYRLDQKSVHEAAAYLRI